MAIPGPCFGLEEVLFVDFIFVVVSIVVVKTTVRKRFLCHSTSSQPREQQTLYYERRRNDVYFWLYYSYPVCMPMYEWLMPKYWLISIGSTVSHVVLKSPEMAYHHIRKIYNCESFKPVQ
jgi:hypothetical protein